MPSVTSSSAQSTNSAHSGTSRSHDAYHGPVEDHDGDYDIDSSVYCTDLMASTTIGGGGNDDPMTGWSGGEGNGGGTPRYATNGESSASKNGGGLMGLLKKSKNKHAGNGKNKNKASDAAAIALAYNDFDDDSSEEQQQGDVGGVGQGEDYEECGESDLGGQSTTLQSIREDDMSSLASGGVSKYGDASNTPPRVLAHKHLKQQQSQSYGYGLGRGQSSSVIPDWARDDDNDDESTEECSDDHPPGGNLAKAKRPAKYPRSKSGGSQSTTTTRRKRNRIFTVVAMAMLFLGLCAVVLGVAYGMGLMRFGGGSESGGKGGKTSSFGGANGSSSQACARTGSCGGGGEIADPALPPNDSTIPTVPTDRPTSPTFDDDADGVCAEHGAKSQSCGAHNPVHPVRCCSGLYCKDKVCTDPNPMKPTASPTSLETLEPTVEPEPSSRPTSAVPTKPPTPNMWVSQPTSELIAEGVVLPPGHFTYDPDDDVYGPQAWSDPRYAATTSVTLDGKRMTDMVKLAEMGSEELDGLEVVPGNEASAEYRFWSRHAWSIDPNRKTAITENICGGGSEQSPIDVFVQSGDIDETGEETGIPGSAVQPKCFEHHEIRIKPGQFSLNNDKIRKEILPSQLRLTYPDPEFEADGKTLAADSKLPTADFPNGWGGNMEALRVDVKIPSEHWLNGKEYAAEYQIYHLHHKKKRAPVISIMVDLSDDDKPNEHFQLALDQWQAVWQKDYLECELRERKDRRATATLMESIQSWISPAKTQQEEHRQSTILDEPAEELEKLRRNLRAARKMQEDTNFAWDPYKKDEIMRSIHFFAYSGSLTEPPCTEFVDWRILDTPMLISRRQLFQMKTLLFKHRSVESGCRPSSNHHMGSVARRPLQPLKKRKVYRCTCRDFVSDEDRDTILALDGMTEANATYTPRCSKREFRLEERNREWLHRPEDEGLIGAEGTTLPEDPGEGGLWP